MSDIPNTKDGQPAFPGAGGSAPFIVCAALRQGSRIICGPRHFDPLMRAQMEAEHPAGATCWRGAEQGFVDQYGNFYGRERALEIARENNQIRRRCGGDQHRLFSENLY